MTAMEPNDYSKLLVCERRCDECLYSKSRIVSGDRARQVIEEARKNDAAFLCHKHTIRGALGLSQGAQANVVCRGYFDSVGDDVLLIRLAQMLGNIVFVNEEGEEVNS
jgi:hypothetical protein